jgi:hypothetical protein
MTCQPTPDGIKILFGQDESKPVIVLVRGIEKGVFNVGGAQMRSDLPVISVRHYRCSQIEQSQHALTTTWSSILLTDGSQSCVASLQTQNNALVDSGAIAVGKYLSISVWQSDTSKSVSIVRAAPARMDTIAALAEVPPGTVVSITGIVISVIDWELRIVELMDSSNHSIHVLLSELDWPLATVFRVLECAYLVMLDRRLASATRATTVTVLESGPLVQLVKELGMAVRKERIRCISEE